MATATRLSIRPGTHNGRDGFHIYGRRADCAWPVRVFTTTRASAEHIRNRIRAGEEIGSADFAVTAP